LLVLQSLIEGYPGLRPLPFRVPEGAVAPTRRPSKDVKLFFFRQKRGLRAWPLCFCREAIFQPDLWQMRPVFFSLLPPANIFGPPSRFPPPCASSMPLEFNSVLPVEEAPRSYLSFFFPAKPTTPSVKRLHARRCPSPF